MTYTADITVKLLASAACTAIAFSSCMAKPICHRDELLTSRASAVLEFVVRLEALAMHITIPAHAYIGDQRASGLYESSYIAGFHLGLLGVMAPSAAGSDAAKWHGWRDGQMNGFVAHQELCDEFGLGRLFEGNSK